MYTSEIVHPVGTSHYIQEQVYTDEFDYTPTKDCILAVTIVYKADSSIYQGLIVNITGSGRLLSFYKKTATAEDITITVPVNKGVTYHFLANDNFPSRIRLNEWN